MRRTTAPFPVRWPAPAKLNLFLHVLGRRADGYHRLQSVFQFLDYGDELSFRVTNDGCITRARPVLDIAEEADLTLRAARALQRAAGVNQGVAVTLIKRIPMGGGLGGGSSDAATTLLALSRLWGLNWPIDALAALGLELGADIPVFLRGRAAWAEGVGELLTPIDLPEPWFVVVNPGVSVSTTAVFSGLQLTHPGTPLTIRDFLAGRATRNDLELDVCRRYPDVARALAWLKNFGAARMTGSGGCVFLAVAGQEQGQQMLAQLPPEYTGFVARGMNVHPLHQT